MLSFGAKKMGRRKIIVLWIIAALAASCGLEEIGRRPGAGDGVWIGPGSIVGGSGSGAEEGRNEVWYTVGVDYPEGYDWRSDEEKGSVRCSLVVFADGIPMVKVPVGHEYEVSSDPDMHRVIGGVLFTDYSTGTETVIKINGTQAFRYAGNEMIVGIAVEGDYVYTLGLSRGGAGFSFRRNGEVLLERKNCHAYPRLQRVEDGFSLAFYEPVDGQTRDRCFHYMAGEVCEIALRKDVVKVWDVICHQDKLCYLASVLGSSEPVIVAGSEKYVLEVPKGLQVESCRFIEGGNYLHVEGIVRNDGGISSALWKMNDLQEVFPSGYIVSAFCLRNDVLACALNSSSLVLPSIIYRGGEIHEAPLGYISMGGQSIVVSNGFLYVGLTSKRGNNAAVWANKEMKPLKINGFISHMSVY